MGWFRRKASRPPPDPDGLLWLTPHDLISIIDAFSGFLAVGAIGAGKTSGPGDAVVRALLLSGAAFVWLVAKTDELSRALRLCRETGREKDFIRIGPGSGIVIDPLDVETQSEGGSVSSATDLLDLLVEIGNRSSAGHGDEKFWAVAIRTHFYFAISAVWLAHGRVTIPDVYRLINAAPADAQEAMDPAWRRKSFCAQCLLEAARRTSGTEFELCVQYWLESFAKLSEKTRSVIHTATTNLLAQFMTGPVAELIVGDTNLFPREILNGKVAVLDLPALRYQQQGVFYQILIKSLVQRAALRRDITATMTPVVIHADEAQLFITSQDALIQTVARQSRLISFALTQNLPALVSQLGGTEKARQEAESWIAGHQTIFIGANTCPTTNEYFSKLCGSSRHVFMNGQCSADNDTDMYDALFGNNLRHSGGWSEQWFADVPQEIFTRLRKGGKAFGNLVDCIVFQSGRIWSNGKTYLPVTFQQGEKS